MQIAVAGGKTIDTKPLKIELVPSSSFYVSLRSVLRPQQWRKISTGVRKKANGICAVCKKRVGLKNLEAHEVWAYDEKTGVRSLEKIIPVCGDCHEAIHIGKAEIEGRLREAALHYMQVNHCSVETFRKDFDSSYRIWQKRSKMRWKTEVGGWVKENGKEDILPACVGSDGVIDETVCPRCGRKLVRMKTPRGTMLGCRDEECAYRRGIPIM